MKRTISMFGALAIAAIGFLFAAPAANAQTFPNQTHGGITCTDYRNLNPGASQVYPNEGHYFVCKTPTFNPTLNKQNVVNGRVNTFRPFAISTLDTRNVTFYFFKNRADAITFMSAKHGAGSPFVNSASQCGHTGQQGSTIESMLYNTCSYTTTQTSNSDLNKATAHEGGHAFDFALGLSHSINPSRSQAFKSLAAGDRVVLTPLNWSTMTATQKAAYVCQMFSVNTPSGLEAALGANPPGFVGQVCTNGTASGLKPEYVGLTPTEIADKKLPYFVNPLVSSNLWQELWAEEFSFLNGGQGIGAQILRFTDTALTAGLSPSPAFNCTRYVVDIWLGTGNPPTPTQLTQQGCPAWAQTAFYHP